MTFIYMDVIGYTEFFAQSLLLGKSILRHTICSINKQILELASNQF